MTIIRWNTQPRFSDAFDNLFEREFNMRDKRDCGCVPRTNITEVEDSFVIEMAAPGMKKDDFRINLEKNLLTVSAEIPEKEEDVHYSRREYEVGSFSRSFTLSDTINPEQIKADYRDGILRIALPKKQEAMKISKEIEITG